MKRRNWMGWAVGVLLAAAAVPGRGADAVVEFYRTQADAGQYILNETSLYELRRTLDDEYGHVREFWRRATEKFAENAEAVRLCGKCERNWKMLQELDENFLEENVGCRVETGDRVFHFDGHTGEHDEEFGKLILAPDGSLKCLAMVGWSTWHIPELRALEEARWQQKMEAVRRIIEERAAELEADSAALFLEKRPDAAGHSLYATSVQGLEFYLTGVGMTVDPIEGNEAHFVAVPGFLEFAEAEKTARQTWLEQRKAIAEKIEAEAEPTDRLYWDVFDDGEHRRAGLLWLRWDGSVREEWPDFGETGEKGALP